MPDLLRLFFYNADRGHTVDKKAKNLTYVLALLTVWCCEVSGLFFLIKLQKAANFLILVANFVISL